jgi:hypothetical protein
VRDGRRTVLAIELSMTSSLCGGETTFWIYVKVLENLMWGPCPGFPREGGGHLEGQTRSGAGKRDLEEGMEFSKDIVDMLHVRK